MHIHGQTTFTKICLKFINIFGTNKFLVFLLKNVCKRLLEDLFILIGSVKLSSNDKTQETFYFSHTSITFPFYLSFDKHMAFFFWQSSLFKQRFFKK